MNTKIFTSIMSILLAFTYFSTFSAAQVPQKVNYQMVVRDANGDLVSESPVGVLISILQGSAEGSVAYAEVHLPQSNINGLISLHVGSGVPQNNTFSEIDWSSGPYFLKVETDPVGGTNYSINSISEILSVPYALHAKTADSLSGGIPATQNLADVLTNGNNANSQPIKNLAAPTENADAATKKYVDDKYAALNSTLNALLSRIEALEGEETFSPEDAPQAIGVTYNSENFSFFSPWGYNKPENSNRNYPIVVIGPHNESQFFTEEVRKKYPSFYLHYGKSNENDGAILADIIRDVIIAEKGHRIDTNRIYLTGWSQGGSGGYNLMRGFYSKGMYFAGMNRIAGQSQTELPDEVVAKTSVWYHIGTNDTDTRNQIAEQAYSFIKNHNYNSNSTETTFIDSVTDEFGETPVTYPRTTKTITKNGIEVFKLSIYEGMWHVKEPPYADSEVFKWLFSQSLVLR